MLSTVYCCSREGHLVGPGLQPGLDDGTLLTGGGDDDGREAWRQHSRDWDGEHDDGTREERPFRDAVDRYGPTVRLQRQQPLQHSCN